MKKNQQKRLLLFLGILLLIVITIFVTTAIVLNYFSFSKEIIDIFWFLAFLGTSIIILSIIIILIFGEFK